MQAISQNSLKRITDYYCENNRINDRSSIKLTFAQRDRATGDPVFVVNAKNQAPYFYTHHRIDASKYSYCRGLDVKVNTLSATPSIGGVVDWVNSKVNIGLCEEDVSRLRVANSKLTVFISPDSMRFKNSFDIRLI